LKKTETAPLFFSYTWDFLSEYLPNKVGRSPDTVESYRDSLTLFRKFLTEDKHVSIAKFAFSDCTKDCTFDFRDYLKRNGNKPSTINVRLAALRAYLNYASDKDISIQSVALAVSQVPPCKNTKEEKQILSESALEAILSVPPKTKMGLRDRTIMVLLYDSAIRLSELLAVKLCDIKIDGNISSILIHGKGSKERRVQLTEESVGHLTDYLRVFHSDSPSDAYLFSTTIKDKTDKMSSGNVQRIVTHYADIVRKDNPDIPQAVHPHMFRRTRATNLYQDGVALELISAILGHANLETTKIYASPSIEQLRSAQNSVPTPAKNEKPLWHGHEAEMARRCGIR